MHKLARMIGEGTQEDLLLAIEVLLANYESEEIMQILEPVIDKRQPRTGPTRAILIPPRRRYNGHHYISNRECCFYIGPWRVFFKPTNAIDPAGKVVYIEKKEKLNE